ncbi:isoleucine--tRNA ligase [Niallia circulans]|uniref:isoleucine--tRNA ligase n=1 Tax=Niallia circulans TaxID=1397 RepID=UPI00201D75EB|nr:isoleucine--tRNA ligase [Niallia circulans]UQZ74961.1 isoleucine--tRNA ligase [Niallia circulans]
METPKETDRGREERILAFWEEEQIFQKSIEQRENKEPFVFYEGPPTANGLPHVGHALGRTIKDIIARFQTMNGKQVIRKAGWDTHGLPVELGVERALGISGKQEIEEYGVIPFIEQCKASVFSYEQQWRTFTKELGYWVDMDDPYMTMSNDYIESVWNILGTIHEKGWLYKGHRVSPYCPSCQTSLSSHEVAQGYKDVKDLSATVKFKLASKENEYVLGWTTTPWTLPANVALAVHKDLDYIKVKVEDDVFIIAKDRLQAVFGTEGEVIKQFKGADLLGLSYIAPFSYVQVEKGHTIHHGDFVTSDSGTGIVHIAPAYGEDDYHLVQANDLSFVHVVDERGRYKEAITPLAGTFVKDGKADVEIIKMLHQKGMLFHKEKYEHSYPHCWRCDTPLLYYATESWFIKTTAAKEMLIAKNQEVNWYPEHIKDGRFGNFLEGLVDWNISRNRYWGTPLNVWQCTCCQTEIAPKSIAQLKKYTKNPFDHLELHKPYVDELILTCPSCSGEMHRTPEVIDVWFDSGSMPFAQYHTPFENSGIFQQQFPADVVVEGIDQTRGWFYSLLAVSVLYSGKAPYKNVVATGHVLDEQGQKMSKSKGNALDPVELIQTYGADALRWALVADSAPWNQKRFSEKNVQEAKSKIIDTFLSLFHFYSIYAEIDHFDPNLPRANNLPIMDRWILSRLETTSMIVQTEMEQYQLTNAARKIAALMDDISNWYIRRNRERFWSRGMSDDKLSAFQTLYSVLIHSSQLLASFIPFTSESIHLALTGKSVHLTNFPSKNSERVNKQLEEQMEKVKEVVELGRSLRHRFQIKTKQPLATLLIFSNNSNQNTDFLQFESIIKEELNVKRINWIDSQEDYVQYSLKLDFKKAGPKLGKSVKFIKDKLQAATEEEINLFRNKGYLTFQLESKECITLTREEILLQRKTNLPGYHEASSKNFTVMLDTTISEALKREGNIRELIRSVQDLRKEKNLPVDKKIDLYIDCSITFQHTIMEYHSLIHKGVILQELLFERITEMKELQIDGEKVSIGLK